MRTKDIEYLVLSRDESCPYREELRRKYYPQKKILAVEDLLGFATEDPAFCGNFVAAHIRARKVLPNQVSSASLWRAYCCRRYGELLTYSDPACFKALALRHPKNRGTQMAIKGLICAGMSPAEIAATLNMSVEVVDIYCQLFFNVAHRLEDKAFMLKVLNPKGHLKMFNGDRAVHNPELVLMNIGYGAGPAAVLNQLGMKSVQEDSRPIGELLANTKQALFAAMELKAKLSLLTTGDLGLSMMRAVVAAEAKYQPDQVDDDARMGLTRLSMSAGAMSVFKRIVTAASEERMRNARIYDEKAAEDAKKKIGDGNAKPG